MKMIAAVLAITAVASTPAYAADQSDKEKNCRKFGELAKEIMSQRQSGAKEEEAFYSVVQRYKGTTRQLSIGYVAVAWSYEDQADKTKKLEQAANYGQERFEQCLRDPRYFATRFGVD